MPRLALKTLAAAGGIAAAISSLSDVAHADSSGSFRFPYLSSSSSPSSSSTSTSDSNDDSSSFSAETLERAAKALREINASPYAKTVFDLMRHQEDTRQAEIAAEKAHNLAIQSHLDIERQKKLAEEQMEALKEHAQAQAQMARHEDELARKRLQVDHEAHRKHNAELVKLHEESNLRKEEARRATEAKLQEKLRQTEQEKAEIERQTIREKAMAEAAARAHEAKLTEEQRKTLLIDRMNGEKEKWIAAINATFSHIEGGVKKLLTDRTTLLMTVGGVTAVAAGVYTTREGARVTWGYINRILGQPSLIRESSIAKFPWSKIASRAKSTFSGSGGTSAKGLTENSSFDKVILHPSLKRRIEHLARATENTRYHQAPFRNMLFYGPPGTGKTLVAREMARKSGLDYAMMTGGDVAPLGSEAVTKIHQIFDWAKNSRKGLLLFIDEADAFLCERNSIHMSEAQRSALNALLFRTGDQSNDIVLVLATNRPGDLDAAITDRIDEVIEFPLPGEEERFKLLNLYLNQYIVNKSDDEPRWLSVLKRQQQQQQIVVKEITEEVLREAAKKTEGFSGREIAKLVASVRAAVYGQSDCVLDSQLLMQIVGYKVIEHHQRIKLASETNLKNL